MLSVAGFEREFAKISGIRCWFEFDKSLDQPVLFMEFDSPEDYTMFLLKWS
jgi:hypothetical protein